MTQTTDPIALNESMLNRPMGIPQLNGIGELEGPIFVEEASVAVPQEGELVRVGTAVYAGDGTSSGRTLDINENKKIIADKAPNSIVMMTSQNPTTETGVLAEQRNRLFFTAGTSTSTSHTLEPFMVIWDSGESEQSSSSITSLQRPTEITDARPRRIDIVPLGERPLTLISLTGGGISPYLIDATVDSPQTVAPLKMRINLVDLPFLKQVAVTPSSMTTFTVQRTGITSLDLSGFVPGGQTIVCTVTDNPNLTSVRAVGSDFSGGYTHSSYVELSLDLSNNNLQADAINTLFRDILPAGEQGEYLISVEGNPGSASCDPTIATDKGYTVFGV